MINYESGNMEAKRANGRMGTNGTQTWPLYDK